MKKTRILVIFTGGTIGSSLGEDGYFSPENKARYKLLEPYGGADWLELETANPYTILSENLELSNIDKLIQCVSHNMDKGYDGIIICHGTDTLQFSAAALSLSLGTDCLPVIFVSSNYILEDERANGRANFAAALDFITGQHGKGVFVAYKNCDSQAVTIHRGHMLLTYHAYDDRLYSLDDSYYGTMWADTFEKNPAYEEMAISADWLSSGVSNIEKNKKAGPRNGQNSDSVLWIKIHPGMNYKSLTKILPDYKAVLVESYHSGTINTENKDFISFATSAKDLQIPVYLVGVSGGGFYESCKIYDDLGIIRLPRITPVSAYIFLSGQI